MFTTYINGAGHITSQGEMFTEISKVAVSGNKCG